ncbi:hypothetical protein P4K96_12245, partial [Bacillus cereus]|nr:hypothetical protein [Bacillus cereus]
DLTIAKSPLPLVMAKFHFLGQRKNFKFSGGWFPSQPFIIGRPGDSGELTQLRNSIAFLKVQFLNSLI